MKIRLAKIEDLEQIKSVFRDIVKDMNQRSLYMWDEIYPFCEFENDINNKEMYILENEDKIIGAFALIKKVKEQYDNIKWEEETDKVIYISRLGIELEQQNKGYAKEMISFAEERAIQNGCKYIRLSVYDKNYIAISLYESLGYSRIEEGYYSFEEYKFIGYEKRIGGS